jgi:hypothetical protein
MKFDTHEFDQLVKARSVSPSPRVRAWTPRSARIIRAVEAAVMGCLAAYFFIGLVGVLTS